MASLVFHSKKDSFDIQTSKENGIWLQQMLSKIAVSNVKIFTYQEVKADYENAGLDDFELFWYSRPIKTLRESGLLILWSASE